MPINHREPAYRTRSQHLSSDPRLIEAKKLILAAVVDHQQPLKSILPAVSSCQLSYATLLQTAAQSRGSPLWFPFIGSGIGQGALVELADGSVKYDFISGIGPHFFGHSHPDLIAACLDAALSDTVMQGNLQQNTDSIALMQQLIQVSSLDHCFLSTSGAMANENALKIAFQKKFPAFRILAFEECFAGRSTAISSITDKSSFRQGLPPTFHVDYLPFYRADAPAASTAAMLTTLKKLLRRYPGEYALMCLELVQGEGGIYAGTTDFFTQLMSILKEAGIAIFVDEVQTFARLPELFAFQYFQLESFVDIVTIGKVSQVCATLFKTDFNPQPGLISQTFTGSSSAIGSCHCILAKLLNEGYYGPLGKIQQLSTHFIKGLTALSLKYPTLIKGPFGLGSMLAFTPFDGSSARVTAFVQALFQAGVMTFIAGQAPTRVRLLLPAGVLTVADCDCVLQLIEQTLLNFEKI